ncbi:MAG: hypothetical protein HC900_00255 [Methylacidiphilales bacterium]|nr:hypothetical protein [Candidatus Methylacidiphilales bacterium]
MTIASEANRAGPYACNGSTTTFPFGFRIADETHVRVVLGEGLLETDLTLGTHYTVSGVGDASGGSITTNTAYASGSTIAIILNIPFLQGLDLENQGAFYAETIEDALDLAAQRDLQLKEEIARCLKMPVSSSDAVEPAELLAARDEAEEARAASEAARDVAVSAKTAAEAARDVAQALAGAAASEIVVTPTGGLIATNVQAALAELDGEVAGKAWTSHTHVAADITDFATAAQLAGKAIGETFYMTGTAAPAGSLKKNGALISRTTYANLWAYAQASGRVVADAGWLAGDYGAFSSGDGSTTFRLPDDRGLFIRCWDDGRGIDAGRAILSYQADALKEHSHPYQNNAAGFPTTAGPGSAAVSLGLGNTGLTGGTETRPKNIALLACIKY